MRGPQSSPVLCAVLLLICTGCATTPTGSSPAQDSVPGISLPSVRILGQDTVYVSKAGEKLEVVHDTVTGKALVKLPDGPLVLLPPEIAGSEGRYRDSRMTVWEHDGGAALWVDGKLVFSGISEK